MKRFSTVWVGAALGTIALAGCVTAPPPQGQAVSAAYVGDRNSVTLDEIVVTVRIAGANPGFYNLHIRPGAIINPKSASFSTPYDVMDIVRRLEPRISSRIVDLLSSPEPIADASLPNVKDQVVKAARATFASAYSRWIRAADYDVEIVVTSFYLTDLSAGSSGMRPARGFW